MAGIVLQYVAIPLLALRLNVGPRRATGVRQYNLYPVDLDNLSWTI
jgi:hypothetical protein